MSEKVTIKRAPHGKENPYFLMARLTAQDVDLSYQALGLLTHLLSLPTDWEVNVITLYRGKGNKRDFCYAAITELCEKGYMTPRTKYQDDKGHWHWTPYYVNEVSVKPHTEKPYTDEPHTEKAEIKTEETQTKEISTEEKKRKRTTLLNQTRPTRQGETTFAASHAAAPSPLSSQDAVSLDGNEDSARAENQRENTKGATATTAPLQSSAKGSPRPAGTPTPFEWAVNQAWQSSGMGSLIAQLLGTAKAEGKRKTFKFNTPATALEIYLFPRWWKYTMQMGTTPLPMAAETLKERFDQFRGHPEYAAWMVSNEYRFEYDYCTAVGLTPTVRADGKRMVSDEEQAVASKRAKKLLENWNNDDYEDRDEDWVTGDYVPAKHIN